MSGSVPVTCGVPSQQLGAPAWRRGRGHQRPVHAANLRTDPDHHRRAGRQDRSISTL